MLFYLCVVLIYKKVRPVIFSIRGFMLKHLGGKSGYVSQYHRCFSCENSPVLLQMVG